MFHLINIKPKFTHFQSSWKVKKICSLHKCCRGFYYNKIKGKKKYITECQPFYVYCQQLEIILTPKFSDVISWAKRLGCPQAVLADNALLFAVLGEGHVANLMHIHPLRLGWTDGWRVRRFL
jgi:hypothetical protein